MFQFPGQSTNFQCPSNGIAPTCAPSLINGAIVSGIASDGNNYTVITVGVFAGSVFSVTGNTVTNVTSTVGFSVVTAASGSTPGTYMIGDTTVSSTGFVNPSSGSSSSGIAGGSSIIIIIVVVVCVLLILAVLFVLNKNKAKASEAKAQAAGAVSFENPMYDDSTSKNPGESFTDNDGLYTEPAYADNADQGYMDVPAGGEETGGYMDVPEGGETSGYMDVEPEDDDDV